MNVGPRIAFFGTPLLAVWVLEELAKKDIYPSLVVTTPDVKVGRKQHVTMPPTKVWADLKGIPTLQTPSLRRGDLTTLTAERWDLFLVAAYHALIPDSLLALPAHRTLNVHPSLLPLLRGPSPVRTALLTDAREAVGVSIIELDNEMDHGPVIAQEAVPLPEWPILGTLLDETLFRAGGRLLAKIVPDWLSDSLTTTPQDHARATYTKKFTREDGELHLTDNADHMYRTYCAMDGWPGTYFFATTLHTEKRVRVKIAQASYEQDAFHILRVVPEGKREMTFDDFLRGYRVAHTT